MMKKYALFMTLAAALLVVACNSSNDKYTIKGQIDNLDDSVLYLGQQTGGVPIFDTLKVKNGAFTFSGKTEKPILGQIVTSDRQSGFPIILEPGEIEVSGDADSMINGQITVTGTSNNEALQEYTDIQKPFMPQMQELQSAYMAAQSGDDQEKMDSVMNVMQDVNEQIISKMKDFVAEHPKSIISAIALQNIMDGMDGEEMENMYAKLSKDVQESPYGELIGNRISSSKNTGIGQEAPEITLNTPEGKPFSLSSLRGQYVLIDFWASWCQPCRVENPNVVATYDQYKDKNFTILGVSLDREKGAWEKAIEDDNLHWHQVSDLKYWESEAAKQYGIQAIPANFLLDPEGKIIARDLRGSALRDKLAEILN